MIKKKDHALAWLFTLEKFYSINRAASEGAALDSRKGHSKIVKKNAKSNSKRGRPTTHGLSRTRAYNDGGASIVPIRSACYFHDQITLYLPLRSVPGEKNVSEIICRNILPPVW